MFTILQEIYYQIRPQVEQRLKEFLEIKTQKNEKKLLEELFFCLFTPQTKSSSAALAIEILKNKDLLWQGDWFSISQAIPMVRFRNNKAKYLVEAREYFSQHSLLYFLSSCPDSYRLREKLVLTIKGIGYKEASHFLRNTGYDANVAILDRHILKNLLFYGVISDIPHNLTQKKYYEIEKKMVIFSNQIGIPMPYLDFVFWYKETGQILK